MAWPIPIQTEEAAYHDGLMVTANMLDYRVPTIQDSPPIEVGIVESIDPHGPFGAKEAGEGSLAATIPAIANAIYDAVGVRLREAPFTPERVLAALRAKVGAKQIRLAREGDDAVAPAQFSEHGGALWFRGKGPQRHHRDPSRLAVAQPPTAVEPNVGQPPSAVEPGGDD